MDAIVSRFDPILTHASARQAVSLVALIRRTVDALDRYLPAVFAIVASPVLLFFALYLPAGQVPDEPSHILRADSLRHGVVIGHRIDYAIPNRPDLPKLSTGAIEVDSGLVNAAFFMARNTAQDPLKLTADLFARWHAIPWDNNTEIIAAENVAGYAAIFYIPAAIAFEAAKLAGGSPASAIIAGRLANMAGYLLLGAAALAMARRGRTALLALLLLPMSLSLAASLNQDGLLIGTAALAAALFSCTGPAESRGWPWWAAAGALACVIMAKPPYLPLALLMLLPLPLRRADWANIPALWTRAIGVCVAVAPGLLWATAVTAFVSAPSLWPLLTDPGYHPGPLFPGDRTISLWTTEPRLQLQTLLAEPARFVTLPLQSVAWHIHVGLLQRMFVGILGTLSVTLPEMLYRLWFWALPAAAIADMLADKSGPGMRRTLPDVVLAVLTVVGSLWAILIYYYLTWTKPGWTEIWGFQGRYLIPPVILMLTGLPGFRLRGDAYLRAAAIVAIAAVALVGDKELIQLFLLRHYVP
jgi:hypothetical protein